MAARTVANDAQSDGGTLEANPIEEIVSIRVDQIDDGERLREIDPFYVEMFAASLERNGQQDPINVCRLPGRDHWTLVTGGHRVAAARSAGIEYLKAIIVGADRDERRRREVIENLHRRDLDPIDRAAFVAEEVALLKARAGIDPQKDGRSASAQKRWQEAVREDADDANATLTIAYGWAENVAGELGFSRSKIERDLRLFRRLSPSSIAKLREDRHPILKVQSELLRLADLPCDEQREVVEYLTWRTHPSGAGPVKKVAEAIALVRDRPKIARSPEDKRINAIISALRRMSHAERVALVQSPTFQDLLPSQARDLLAPIRRDGEDGQ